MVARTGTIGSIMTSVNSVAWNGTHWVAVGQNGTAGAAATSPDGILWTSRSINSAIAGNVWGVAWNGTQWVAVGESASAAGAAATSPDGITWTSRTISGALTSIAYGVAWNGTQWVAVGQSGLAAAIATSSDGITWASQSVTAPTTSVLIRVAWNGTLWVAVGSRSSQGTGLIATSPNGTTWTSQTPTGFTASTTSCSDVAWNGTLWVVVGYNNGLGAIARSLDGVTWTASTVPGTSTALNSVSWNGSLWVVGGQNGSFSAVAVAYTSPDGVTWTQRTPTITSAIYSVRARTVLPFVGTTPVPSSGGGVTISGSTTSGNLLTAVGTSSGISGNSGLTYNGTNLNITGSVTASTTLQWGPYSNARTQTGNAFARLFGNYTGSGTFPNDFFITNNIATPTITATGITATANDSVAVPGTAAIRLGTNQAGGTYGAITLYTGLTTAALTPSLVVSNTYASIGTSNLPAFSGLNVNGGLVLSNGYRPLYASVTASNLTSGTSPSINATSYGTHYNIINSGFNAITLPSSTASTDLNAYWVFRNNTGSYLSITVTYTGNGGGSSPTNQGVLTIPPATSTTIMFVTNTFGSGAYAFF